MILKLLRFRALARLLLRYREDGPETPPRDAGRRALRRAATLDS